MWWLRWMIAGRMMAIAVWIMPRSQPRDCYVEALKMVRPE